MEHIIYDNYITIPIQNHVQIITEIADKTKEHTCDCDGKCTKCTCSEHKK